MAGLLQDTVLRDSQFRVLTTIMRDVSGVNLTPGKETLVHSRITGRLRALGLSGFDEYVALLQSAHGQAEVVQLVDALTTNKTSFFREPEHFRYLEQVVFPEAISRGGLTAWSAGCSSGEEAYTIAMLARDGMPATRTRILATDISTRVLARATAAEYSDDTIAAVPRPLVAKHFEQLNRDSWIVDAKTRELVVFARLNLMTPWPMRKLFDVIFCRNVMIYFERDVQQKLVHRFSTMLRPGGVLFVGHSESLSGIEHELRYVQPAVYIK